MFGFEPARQQEVSKTIREANHTACKAEDVSWDSLIIVDRNSPCSSNGETCIVGDEIRSL